MRSIKQVNVENRTYYLVIYNIRYITVKSLNQVNIVGENPLYLIFNNVDGCIEESKR